MVMGMEKQYTGTASVLCGGGGGGLVIKDATGVFLAEGHNLES